MMDDFFGWFGGGDEEVDVGGGEGAVSGSDTKTKKLRSALYSTKGGASGAELSPGQTSKRDTLLGN